jgi:cholesterol transport system auxiliary component
VKRNEIGSARPVAIAVLLAAALAGCALPRADEVEVRKEVLSQLPQDLPRAGVHGGVLLVLAPQAAAPYDGTPIAYAIRPYEIGYFGRHEWADTPPRMLGSLLVQTLERSGRFAAVVAPPYAGAYRYVLHTEVRELLQDFTAQPPVLTLSLHLQLSGAGADHLVAAREISVREPMREKSPYAGVVAANEATAKALREVAEFVIDKAR